MKEAICAYIPCSKPFIKNNGKQKCCSESCKGRVYRAKKGFRTGAGEIAVCPHCTREFKKRRPDQIYCRKNCKKAASAHRSGKDIRRNQKYFEKYGRHRIACSRYKKYRKDVCENCGFIPIHICQLDVDHIDGNHKNDDVTNLRTLCANCHRLKTMINKDGIYKWHKFPKKRKQ